MFVKYWIYKIAFTDNKCVKAFTNSRVALEVLPSILTKSYNSLIIGGNNCKIVMDALFDHLMFWKSHNGTNSVYTLVTTLTCIPECENSEI